jgi:FSR family fosmidomycin resistance protein-like MFS transporter
MQAMLLLFYGSARDDEIKVIYSSEAYIMEPETIIEESEFKTSGVTTVSVAHAVHDTYSAFLPALLPLLIEKFSLTNTAAGLFSVFYQLPSLLQPLIGWLADRVNLRWMIILAPTITGAAMSTLGIAPTYGFAAFLLLLAGISSSTLHATGPVLGSTLSGKHLGRGMSFWMVGGELGRALGPVIIVTAIAYLTVERLPWLMLAGALASIFLAVKLDRISTRTQQEGFELDWRLGLKQLRPLMLPLAVILFIRSLAMSSLTTYLPTFLTREGSTLWMAGFSLTILEVAGMVGAFLAGGLSDKFGRRRMLVISFITTPILMALFVFANAFWKLPLLLLLGFFAISVVPVIMAIVMENAPGQRAFANGIYMASSFLLHSLAVIVVGLVSDWFDLRFTFLVTAGLLPLSLPFVLWLPKSIKRG